MPRIVLIDLQPDRHDAGGHPRHRPPALDLKYIQAGLAPEPAPILATPPELARLWPQPPQLALIRAGSATLDTALALGRRLRAAGCTTLALGPQALHAQHATPSGWSDAYDGALPGEAETAAVLAVRELLDPNRRTERLQRLKLDFAAGRVCHLEHPERLPPLHYSPAELRAGAFPFALRGCAPRHWAWVQTSWGCPHPCLHCSVMVRKSSGKTLRLRPPAAIADEIAALLDAGAEAIAFEDDSLFTRPAHFLDLAEHLARRQLLAPWLANARPDELTPDIIAAAADCGARLLKIGVDSGSARIIERIGKARDGLRWLQQARDGFARLDRAGIGRVALCMVGLPDETEADIAATGRLLRELDPDYLQVQLYTPYPDSPLWQALPASERPSGALYHYRTPSSSPSRIDPGRLPLLQRRLYHQHYLRAGFVWKHLRHGWRHYLRPATLGQAAASLGYLLR